MTDIGFSMAQEQIKELKADNERLRAQGVHLADALYAGQQENDRLRKRVAELNGIVSLCLAEGERLKQKFQHIARFALAPGEPKP